MSLLPAKTVLIVDDEAAHAYVCERVLQSAGHNVLSATNAADALNLLEGAKIDLALVDMFMPETDGLEVIKTMRSRRPEIVIVAMSGGFRADVTAECSKLGVRTVLEKPFDVERLLATVNSVISKI